MRPCPECSGAGFFGDTGPIAERCLVCRGTGELPELKPATLRAVPKLDEIQFRQIFWQMEERSQRQGFGS